MNRMTAIFIWAMLTAGCVAADSNSIKPMSISTMGYAQADCGSLAVEDQRVADRLYRLSLLQDRQRTADVVGVVLIGVSPTGMGSPEHASEIARLKGERETIASVKSTKGCTEPAAVPDEDRIKREVASEMVEANEKAKAKSAMLR